MADDVKMQGIEFEIKTKAAGSVKPINDLSAALKKLKDSSDSKFSGLSDLAGRLTSVANAANRIQQNAGAKLESLANGLNAIKKVGKIELSDKIGSYFTNMANGLDSLSTERIDKISRFASSVNKLKDINAIKISNKLPDQIVLMSAAINELNPDSVRNVPEFVKGLQYFSQVQDIKINPTLAKDVRSLSGAIAKIPAGAKDSIEALTTALTALNGVETSKIGGFADEIAKLGTALKSLGKGSAKELEALSKAMVSAGKVDFAKFAGAIESISTNDGTIKSVAEQLKAISELDFSNLSDASRSIGNIVSKFGKKAGQIFGAISPKGSGGGRGSGKAKRGLPSEAKDAGTTFQAAADETVKVSEEEAKIGKAADDAARSTSGLFKGMSASAVESLSKLKLLETTLSGLRGKLSAALSAKDVDDTKVASLASRIQNVKSQIKSLGKAGIGAFAERLKSGFSSAAGAVGRFSVGLATAPFRRVGANISAMAKSYRNFTGAIGRIAIYRAIRAALKEVAQAAKEGTENLYNYSKIVGTEFHKSMDRIASDALYIKNSFATVGAPIINALAPVFDMLADKIAYVLNLLAQLMAALTGKSIYTKAIRSMTEYGDATAAASKALKDFTMGFDELNVINDDAGGRGGAAIPDYSKMFEEDTVSSPIADFANRLKEMINAGDWEGAGKLLAQKLNGLIELWDAEKWGRILGEKINNGLKLAYGFMSNFNFEGVGQKVAQFFNGIFDSIDWDTLGKLLATKFNAILDFLYGFISTFDWSNFGKSIADAFVGFFSEIKWGRIIELIKAGIDGIADAITGFLTELGEKLNIQNITDPIVNIVNTISSTLKQMIDNTVEWFSNLNFEPLSNAFGTLLEKIDPLVKVISEGLLWAYNNVLLPLAGWFIEEAAPKGIELLASVIDALKVALEVVGPIAKGIYDNVLVPLGGFAWNVISDALESIKNILKELSDLLQGNTTFKEFFDNLSGKEKILTGIATAFAIFYGGAKLAKTAVDILAGVKATIVGVKGAFSILGTSVGTLGATLTASAATIGTAALGVTTAILAIYSISKLSEAANTYHAAMETHKKETENALSNYQKLYETKGKDIADEWAKAVYQVDLTGKTFEESQTALTERIETLWDGVPQNMWDGFKQGWDHYFGSGEGGGLFGLVRDAANGIVQWFKDILGIHSPSTVMAEIGGNIVEGLNVGISEKWAMITTFFATALETLKAEIGQKWDEIKENTFTTWENIKTNTVEVWAKIKSTLTATWDNLKTDAASKFDNIKSAIAEKWESTKTDTAQKWTNIKTDLQAKWTELKNTAATQFTNIKDTVSQKWTDTKTDSLSKWGEIKTSLSNTWEEIKSGAVNAFTGLSDSVLAIWNNLWSSIRNVLNGIIGGVEGMANGIVRGINGMIRALNKLHFDIPDWVPALGGKSFSLNISEVSTISIPRLADGGAVDYGQLFLARESGPELVANAGGRTNVMNNDNIVNSVSNGVAQANAEQNALLREQNDLLAQILAKTGVSLDGKTLMKSVEHAQYWRGANILRGGVTV